MDIEEEQKYQKIESILNKNQNDDFYQYISQYKHEDEFLHMFQKQQVIQDASQEIKDLIIHLQAEQFNVNKKISELKEQIRKLEQNEKSIQNQIEQLKKNGLDLLKQKSNEQRLMLVKLFQIKVQGKGENKNGVTRKYRRVYSTENKKTIVKALELFSITDLCKHSGVHKNQILRWKKYGCENKSKSGRPISSLELEIYLINYIQKQRSQQRIITRKFFQKIAQAESQRLNLDLKISSGFLERFLKINNIVMRVINSKKKIFAELATLNDFISTFKEKLNSQIYDCNHIINFDETSLHKFETGIYTLAKSDEKHVQVKSNCNEKLSYSIGLVVSYSGLKLKQVIIWPTKGVKDVFKSKIPDNTIVFYRQEGSYFTKTLFTKWVQDILIPYSDSLEKGKRGLLLLDNFSGHSYDTFKEDLTNINYDFLLLPPNSTDRLQPLDISINRAYKQKYRNLCLDHQLLLDEQSQTDISHGEFLNFISQVWQEIDSKQILNSWNCYREEKDKLKNKIEETLNKQKQSEIELELEEIKNMQDQSVYMMNEQEQIEEAKEDIYNDDDDSEEEDSNTDLSNSQFYEFIDIFECDDDIQN